MTIRISLRVVAFVAYTLALLGGAFGISYAVFEWRDEDAEIRFSVEKLDSKTDGLAATIKDVNDGIGSLRGQLNRFHGIGFKDLTTCHFTLIELITVVALLQSGQLSVGAFESQTSDLFDVLDSEC